MSEALVFAGLAAAWSAGVWLLSRHNKSSNNNNNGSSHSSQNKTVWGRRVVVQQAEQFDKAVQEATRRAGVTRVFVLFVGQPDAQTGVSWCPDCVQAEPHLQKALSSEEEDTVLLEVQVARSEYKGIESYHLRRNPAVRLRTVPTFGKWLRGKLEMRLEDHQCCDEAALAEVLER